MALLSKDSVSRIDIEHEPGQWVELRTLTVASLARLQTQADGKNETEIGIQILLEVLARWSYDAPIDDETLGRLDMETFGWLMTQIDVGTGLRSAEEKKASTSVSRVGRGRVTALGRSS